VERAAGRPLADLARAELFQPLGMSRTGYEQTRQSAPHVARPHHPSGEPAPYRFYGDAASAGLVTTVRDLARLYGALFFDPKPFLPPLARNFLVTPLSPPTPEPQRSLFTMALAPEAANDPLVARYGPGTVVFSLPDGRRIVGHSGSNWGVKSASAAIPETGDGFIMAANSESGNGVLSNLQCRWRKAVDGLGRAEQDACLEHGHSRLQALYATGGAEAAINGLRQALQDPGLRLFVVDTTLVDVANGFVAFAAPEQRAAREADARRLIAANAQAFPNSARAQAAWAGSLLESGDVAGAKAALERVAYLDPAGADLIASLAGRLAVLEIAKEPR